MTALAPVPTAAAPERAVPAPPARLAAVLAVLVAILGATLGPTGGLDPLFGPRGLTVADGVVERQVGEDWEVVPPGTRIVDGSVLRSPAGVATLVAAGGTIALARDTRVEVGEVISVDAGTVVVDAAETAVGTAGVTARGDGAWRWDSTGRVGAYAGSVVVTDATGRDRLVRSLEQAGLRDAVVTADPQPYAYTDADPFDRQHLADAMGVDAYVAALRGGLAAEYGTSPQPRAFYTDFDGLDGQLVTALGDVGFDRSGSRIGPPADVLVASVVTDALVVDAGLEPQAAADEVRTLRLAGATWGLIAQGRDLDAGDVRAAADRALARRDLAEQQGVATPAIDAGVPTQAPTAPGTPTGDPGPDTTPPTGGAPGPDGEGSSPPPTDEPEDDPGLVGSVVDETGANELLGDDLGGLVDDVVDAADDLLDGPDPSRRGASPSEAPTDGGLLDATGEVVKGTVDTLEGVVGGLLGP